MAAYPLLSNGQGEPAIAAKPRSVKPSPADPGVMVISGVWKQVEGVAYPVG